MVRKGSGWSECDQKVIRKWSERDMIRKWTELVRKWSEKVVRKWSEFWKNQSEFFCRDLASGNDYFG